MRVRKRYWLFLLCLVGWELVGAQVLMLPYDSATIVDLYTEPDSIYNSSDTILLPALTDSLYREEHPDVKVFFPNPQTSLWCAIAFPGLGQIYNRKYWKLPIVYGGAVGFVYAISWNNRIYNDYLNGYRDIMDNNPDTKSYENLLPAGMGEEWQRNTLRSGMNNYRRYRDLSIVLGVVFYAITVVDAYVDAQLADFDISPDLSMKVAPKLLENPDSALPTLGVSMALNF